MTGGQQGPEVELLAQDRGDLSGAALGQFLECSAPVSHLICWQSSAVGQCVAWWHILCQPTPQVPVTGVSALSTQGIFAKCHQCCHPKATARKGSPGSVPHCKGCVVPKPHFALLFLQFFPSPGNSTCAARAHGEQAARPRSANNQRELGTQPRVTAPLP